jgi:hypothetical protein
MWSWANIVAGALKLLNALADYFGRKQLLDAGRDQQRADNLTEQQSKVRDANQAAIRRRTDPEYDDRLRDKYARD